MSQTHSLQARPVSQAPVIQAAVKSGTVQRKTAAIPSYLQRKALVSRAQDPAEREADATARNVMSMAAPPISAQSYGVQRKGNDAAPVTPTPAIDASGGSPLSPKVRAFFEPRFKANFSGVRIHADGQAAQMAKALNAKAFTTANHIYFAMGQFQPETEDGLELLAHELTHTIQQGAVIQRKEADVAVKQSPSAPVQKFGISDLLDFFADKANAIPGYRMFTIILGVNPINMSSVDRSAANILRALVEFIPGGFIITQALDRYQVFEKAGKWVELQINELGLTGSAIKKSLNDFIDDLGWRDLFHPFRLFEKVADLFLSPIKKIITLAGRIGIAILQFIRDAVLLPLAKLAEGTRGWDLVCALLGKNPITGQPSPRTAETLVAGFMKLIGKEEVWQRVQETKALSKIWQWFQGAMAEVMAMVTAFPDKFIATLKSLEVGDFLILPKAIGKILGAFGSFVVGFVKWAGNAVWKLLEIIFSVVSPGAWKYIQKVGAALRSILTNPIPFVKNLGKSAKDGFSNFKNGFLGYLTDGLIGWLTGNLPGVYIPKALEIKEIARFVLSVLGLTWPNLRAKMVKAIGETAVVVLETTFDIVKTLVRDGPAAAWEQIKEQLTNLKEMAIGAIIDLVVDIVTKKAIPKLVSMFIPGLGFVSAIMSVYDMVMVIVDKIAQIVALVTGFLDSIVAIAGGNTGAAAKKIESVLANGLSLAIVFAAGFASIGRVADKVKGVLEKIRAPFDKALDWLVGWIKKAGQAILAKVMGRSNETPEQKQARLRKAAQETLEKVNKYAGKAVGEIILKPMLALIKFKHGLTSITPIPDGKRWSVRLEINPIEIVQTDATLGEAGLILKIGYEKKWPLDEFNSKANAIKRAAESKKVENLPDVMALITQTGTGGLVKQASGATEEMRQGGQAEFRGVVHSYINENLKLAAIDDARALMNKLQADHQVELQVGGTDKPENIALIEGSMNSSMGAKLKNALKKAEVLPATIITRVDIDLVPKTKDKHTKKDSGSAKKLLELLTEPSNHRTGKKKEDREKLHIHVWPWFRLGNQPLSK